MAHAEYFVINRDRKWWVTMDGTRTGPHDDRLVAIHAAITAAKLYCRVGHSANVSIDEPIDGISIVFSSDGTM